MSLVAEGTVTEHGLAAAAPATVAAVLADRLTRTLEAFARLGQPGDVEALHDFRVALRRFRSLLRVYGDLTEEAVPRRLRRRLRRLARATNASRDLEVKLDWLAPQAETLRPRERTGHKWLTGRLITERDEADRAAMRLLEHDVVPLARTLEHRLGEPSPVAAPGLPFAAATARLLREYSHELERDLDRVRTIEDQEEAHDARIAGKRVRYLLEPLTAVLPLAGDLVDRLRALQDLLGEMHDADVAAFVIAEAMEDAATEGGQRVAERLRSADTLDAKALRRERRRDPMPGLLALASRVQQRREAAWTELARDWLPHRQPRLAEPLAAVAAALEQRAPAGVEIERKYLLSRLPERAREETPAEIDQGYLPGEQIQERVRRIVTRGGTGWFRTVKLGAGVVRQEFEEPISEALFAALWPLTEGRRVRKRRYKVPDGALTWEVDEFLDRELALAEVELPAPDLVPALPEWLASAVVREVTDDPAYLNLNLAR